MVVAVLRPLADLLSAVLYVVKGQFPLAKATVKAYLDFFAWHKPLGEKRRQIRASRKSESSQILCLSMVVRYMLGAKCFSKLIKQ